MSSPSFPMRLRNPACDLEQGAEFFLTAAHATPPRFFALKVLRVEDAGRIILVAPTKIAPLSKTARDYRTAGEVRSRAEIIRSDDKAPGAPASGRSPGEG